MRLSRRDLLRVGTLGLGGLSLPSLLAAREAALRAGRPAVRDRSVVFLFMHGGPSQIETFDPKMDAPSEVRSVTGEVPTTLPGVAFGATMHRLARLAHRLAVVRSFATGDGRHDIKPVVSRHTGGAGLGSIYARVAGTNHPETGMPENVLLAPRAVEPASQPILTNFGRFDATGALGAGFAPFVPGGGGDFQEDLTLHVPRARLDDRRRLLGRLDDLRRKLDATGALEGIDRTRQQAFDMILRGVSDAFDLSREDPRVLERYDTSRLVPPETIDKKWNNRKFYTDHGQTLGKLLLMARRLCERGCGFVTVTSSFVWDMHADQNNATMSEGMRYVGLPFDHAVSAFIEDVEARGLSDRILLVACGEMGRTPKLNKRGGRDHWGRLAPLLLAGGGLRMGQVIGQSSADAGEPSSEPITIDRLIATILHALFDVGQLRLVRGMPRDILRLAEQARPIDELL